MQHPCGSLGLHIRVCTILYIFLTLSPSAICKFYAASPVYVCTLLEQVYVCTLLEQVYVCTLLEQVYVCTLLEQVYVCTLLEQVYVCTLLETVYVCTLLETVYVCTLFEAGWQFRIGMDLYNFPVSGRRRKNQRSLSETIKKLCTKIRKCQRILFKKFFVLSEKIHLFKAGIYETLWGFPWSFLSVKVHFCMDIILDYTDQ